MGPATARRNLSRAGRGKGTNALAAAASIRSIQLMAASCCCKSRKPAVKIALLINWFLAGEPNSFPFACELWPPAINKFLRGMQ